MVNSDEPTPGAPDRPVDEAVHALRAADAAMARALRAVATARPVNGMPAERVIAQTASATGWDVAHLSGVAATLSAMPHVWRSFDDGHLGWSQVRGIARAARDLRRDDRASLDAALTGAIAENATSEPERVVEVAEDIARRLDEPRTAQRERSARSRSWLAFQQRLDEQGADVRGYIGDAAAVTEILDALDAAADPPEADSPARDDDGRPLPKSWRPGTTRAAQHAEALRRVCTAYHRTRRAGSSTADHPSTTGDSAEDAPGDAGASAPHRPRLDGPGLAGSWEARAAMYAVVDVRALPGFSGLDLRADADDGVPAVTPRVLWSLAGGRATLSRARVHQLACDAMRIPVLTDGATVLAMGDANDPIGLIRRRAVAARDQGCRMPGCRAPVAHTDVHHIVDRDLGGPTELDNLVALCRACHTDVHARGWRLHLHPDGRLTVRNGRHSFTSRPPLRRPPPVTGRARPDAPHATPPQRAAPPSTARPSAGRDPLPF